MRTTFKPIATFLTILALWLHTMPDADARGGGRSGGGGRSMGGGSFSRGGGGVSRSPSRSSYSRPASSSQSRRTSRPSTGSVSRPSQPSRDVARPAARPATGNVSRPATSGISKPASRPATSVDRPGGGRVPSGGSTRDLPSGVSRPSLGDGATQLPSGVRPGAGNRPSTLPSKPGGIAGGDRPGAGNRPGAENRPGTDRPGVGKRPNQRDVDNFLGIGAGAGAGGALANRPGSGDRPGIGNRPGAGDRGNLADRRPADRPQDRPDWSERSQNRSEKWKERDQSRQQRRDDFAKNRDQRWDNINKAREDRQDWRDHNREDWQDHREEMWDYRFDRADEVWDHCRDYYDHCFDDHWWGSCGWGYGWGYVGHYPVNPWWWWRPVTWAAVTGFVYAVATPPQPVYIDYGTTVDYEGATVYVDNKPVPAEQYDAPVEQLATGVDQPPPPLPPSDQNQAAEWMPLGVFALAQEEKGDPVMFFQISVSKDGKISGGYESTLTGDKKPIAGSVDKKTQNVAWRIGDNVETVYATTLANLTQDVSTVAVHFGKDRVQEWLLVRMPEPQPADQAPKAPELKRDIPPDTPVPLPASTR